MSHAHSLTSLSHRRNGAKANKAIAINRKPASEPSEDRTVAANISTVMGSFLALGLASCLCNPSITVCMNGELEVVATLPSGMPRILHLQLPPLQLWTLWSQTNAGCTVRIASPVHGTQLPFSYSLPFFPPPKCIEVFLGGAVSSA